MFRGFYTSQEIAELRKAGNRIFGTPAATLTLNQNTNNTKGFIGEQIIGNILNLATIERPDTYVCHSVTISPTLTEGEIDHILIRKNRIILIETKAYSAYTHYRINKEGVLTASVTAKGHARRVEDSNANKKRKQLQAMFPNREVLAIVAIPRDTLTLKNYCPGYTVTSLDTIQHTIEELLDGATDIAEPTWGIVKHFATLCLPPHQNRNKMLPITGEIPTIAHAGKTPQPHTTEHPRLNKGYTCVPALLR